MITITIPGEARGKGRPRFARRGNFVKTYTDEKTASYENLVAMAGAEAMQGRPLIAGAVHATMEVRVAVPKSWSKKKTAAALAGDVLPTTKPDLDNVIKAIMDALNGIVWQDDKQVVQLAVRKRYAEKPYTTLNVIEQ